MFQYNSCNEQPLFLLYNLADWSFLLRHIVFSVRYELDLYMCFRLFMIFRVQVHLQSMDKACFLNSLVDITLHKDTIICSKYCIK